jgi:D-glycerate 3-kinase
LLEPVNELERLEDADGRWRGYVNEQLAGSYRQLFACVDVLLMLRAPSFDCVFEWRRLQERKLAAKVGAQGVPAGRSQVMDDAALRRFIMHFERITRHLQEEMPARADLVAQLDADRRIIAVRQSG